MRKTIRLGLESQMEAGPLLQKNLEADQMQEKIATGDI